MTRPSDQTQDSADEPLLPRSSLYFYRHPGHCRRQSREIRPTQANLNEYLEQFGPHGEQLETHDEAARVLQTRARSANQTAGELQLNVQCNELQR